MNLADRPNRFPWPPVLAVLMLLLGLLSRLVIVDRQLFPGQIWVGAALALCGVALIFWAFFSFVRASSNILPNRAADRLITHGPFRLSRNPIYTGEIMAMAGMGIALGAPGLILAAALLAILVQKLGIEREEAHLAARFGKDWEDFRRRTRRWL
jgi:protein-S-isoprenylcysteine O-methyltransferase Ste14